MTQVAAAQLVARMNLIWHTTYSTTRRIVIAVFGVTVILLGVVLIFTPGPALVVIPLGLAILATEFFWARRLLRRMKAQAKSAYQRIAGRTNGNQDAPPDDEA